MNPHLSIIRLGWLGLLALVLGFFASAGARTFTDTQGRKIEAEVIDVTGTNVTLRLQSGKSATIPITKLSEDDRLFIAQWKDQPRADPGDGSNATTPANINNLIAIDAKKVRLEKGQKKKVGEGEVTEERWVFAVEVRNKSRVDLEGLKMSYRIYVDPQASKKLTFGEADAFYDYVVTLDKVARSGVIKRNTEEVLLNRIELDAAYEFNDGSRSRIEDKLEGIWIKIWQGNRKVAEFKSNDATVKKAKWPDAEPTDEPTDEPAAEPADG